MTMRSFTNRTSAGRYRLEGAVWAHVGECTRFGIRLPAWFRQRDGRRVSAAGDAR